MSGTSNQPPRRRTANRRRSLQWDDAAIAQAAQVGPGDADAVSAWFDKHAPKEARTLLDSLEEEPDGGDGVS